MKWNRKGNNSNIYKNWRPCYFREMGPYDLVRCSSTELQYPKNAFRNEGITRVYNVKSGRHIGRYQEYLINNEWIFKIKGGNNWEIKYVCTLADRAKEESSFGEKILYRAKESDTPWHIALLTCDIKNDDESIQILMELNQIAEAVDLTKDQLFALRGYDQVIRNLVLRQLVGDELWNKLETVLLTREKLARYLSYYFVVHGKVKTDINEVCHIPSPKPVTERELYGHEISYRAFSADVPKPIAQLADYVDDNEDAIELLKEIKTTVATHSLSLSNKSQLNSQNREDCLEVIREVLGEELYGMISQKLSIKPVLEKELTKYILVNSKRTHFVADQEI